MTSSIWHDLPKPALMLAPMEGVTDVIFRQVIAKAGRPDLFFTEFTNVSSYASEKGRQNALERLQIAPSDPPIVAQVWGQNPDHFATTVAALERLGFAGVDLNFGCPDRHVIKAGGGANMIRTPDLAVDCLRRAQAATRLPVSIKTRLGYSRPAEFKTWLPTILAQHPAALTVHLRTKQEMSKVPAHYELIPAILDLRAQISPETKLVVNGDIKDRTAALALHAHYPQVDGFMIGRGVFQNPFCFRPAPSKPTPAPPNSASATTNSAATAQPAQTGTYQPTRSELLDLLNFHLDLFEEASRTRYLSYEPLKHFFKIYINHFPGAADLRNSLMQTHSLPEARKILKQYF